MAKLAFYIFAVLEEAFRHQHSRGFVDRITGVFESAEQASRFVGRADSVRHEGQDAQWEDPLTSPRFNARQRDAHRNNSPEVSPDDYEAATLSLWDD